MSMTIRKYFFDEVEVNGNKEIDYLSTRLTGMSLSTVDTHRVSAVTAGRLDLISVIFYGTYDLGWLICEHNQLKDPVGDVFVGRVLKIPSITEYYQYYNRNTRKV